jgi:hypothetical protein
MLAPKDQQRLARLSPYISALDFLHSLVNPNWHETGWIYLPYNFRIGFCKLNFYQKFPNIFGGEN